MTSVIRRTLIVLTLALASGPALAREVVVFAAASLKNVLDDAAAQFEAQTGVDVALSYAGSSALARQIQQGAPADIFVSANMLWMDLLETDGLIVPASRTVLAGNTLVLIASTPGAVALAPEEVAARLGDDGKLAMALVNAVPAGIYGKAALETLDLWSVLEPSVVQTDNVRAALRLVTLGEAKLGIVYATDARLEDNAHVLAEVPVTAHPPILYPAAQTTDSSNDAATALLAYLQSSATQSIFAKHGFVTEAAQ